MLRSYKTQSGFEARWADPRACFDLDWLLLLAHARSAFLPRVPVGLIGCVAAIGVLSLR